MDTDDRAPPGRVTFPEIRDVRRPGTANAAGAVAPTASVLR